MGATFTGSNWEAYRWTETFGKVGLGHLDGGETTGAGSRGTAISADGRAIVGQSSTRSGAQHAFRWTEQTGLVSLGGLTAMPYDYARDVCADGSRIVGCARNRDGFSEAFLWDPDHGMRALDDVLRSLGIDMTGGYLEDAVGISDDGTRIVGNGRRLAAGNQREGWLAVIPEPGTAWLFAAGLSALAARARRGGTLHG